MKHSIVIASVLLLLTALGACNTMRGFGKDVERGGERVQDAAQRTQQQM